MPVQGMTSHLANASGLGPPSTSAAAARQWVAAADHLMQQSASFRADYMTRLQQCEVEVEEAVQNAFVELKQQARYNRPLLLTHAGKSAKQAGCLPAQDADCFSLCSHYSTWVSAVCIEALLSGY